MSSSSAALCFVAVEKKIFLVFAVFCQFLEGVFIIFPEEFGIPVRCKSGHTRTMKRIGTNFERRIERFALNIISAGFGKLMRFQFLVGVHCKRR
jgi:hypothetical protein